MPAIQDTYSVDVRNRYDLGFPESDDDSQEVENVDPLDQLRMIEEEKERERLEKKQLKLQQAAAKKTKKPNAKGKEASAPRKEAPGAEVATGGRPDRGQRGEYRPRGGQRGGRGGGQYNNDQQQPPRRRNFRGGEGRGYRGGHEGGDGGDNNGRRNYDGGYDGENRRSYGQDGENRRSYGQDGGERRSYENRQPYYQRDNYRENRVGQDGGEGGEGRPERPERFRGNRGGAGYRGGNRGGGGYRGGRDDRGKREFDRRSGNDKSSMRGYDKREGGGSHNWGTPGNEFEDVNEVTEAMDGATVHEDAAATGEQPEVVKAEGEEAAAGDEAAAPAAADEAAAEPEAEPEPVEMTLDEWRAQQASSQKKQEFNIRKPGEGENQKEEWKNLKELKKQELYDDAAEEDHVEYRRQFNKTHVDLNIQFTEQPNKPRGRGGMGGGRGGRGRGGRGGGRGLGGGRRGGYESRGDRRMDKGTPRIPDVQNEAEFPTLG